MNIDFKKYKRFIVAGCSFTNYYWPTWADILYKEMPHATYYNFARCGGGNFFIASRLTEANVKLNFTDTDLVMVMWTTLCREDRYLHGNWNLSGNIFTQEIYPKEFVEKFADPEGYLVKDLSLIKMATDAMKLTKATFISLNCQNYDEQQDKDHHQQLKNSTRQILNVYDSFIKKSLPTMYDLEMNKKWEYGHTYIDSVHGAFQDYHPNPTRYSNYLEKLGFNLTSASKNFANNSTLDLLKTKTKEEIINRFCNEPNANHNSVKDICF